MDYTALLSPSPENACITPYQNRFVNYAFNIFPPALPQRNEIQLVASPTQRIHAHIHPNSLLVGSDC